MLQTIETKFGNLYIEKLDEQREEDERIKIFDSLERYLDYFMLETLEDNAQINGHTSNEELQIYIKYIEASETIEDLVDHFLSDGYELITTDWEEAASYMRPFCIDEYGSEDELLTNEWINKIGDYYIVVSEY